MASSDNPPPVDDKQDREADPEADRISLRSLSQVSAPVDLARTVPELIRRRSQGRFFGRKRLADRLPLEWLSLGMLILLAAIYAALKMLSTN
jgi:type VI protein secretion system component VasF